MPRELWPDDEDLDANFRHIQSVKEREEAKGGEGDAKTALRLEYANEGGIIDPDEAGAVATEEGIEAILRTHKAEEERKQGAFRLDIEVASKKEHVEKEGIWQRDW